MPLKTLNGTCTIFCDSGIRTGLITTSPGVSSVPAKTPPSITESPPKSSACDAAVLLHAAVGDQGVAAAGGTGRRLHLRHTEVRRQPRSAAPAGTDADLDAVDAALEKKPGAVGGRDVAGNQFDRAMALADLLDRALHHQ